MEFYASKKAVVSVGRYNSVTIEYGVRLTEDDVELGEQDDPIEVLARLARNIVDEAMIDDLIMLERQNVAEHPTTLNKIIRAFDAPTPPGEDAP